MSLMFPYDYSVVLSQLSTLFNVDLSSLTPFENTLLVIITNFYFFAFWFFIIYFAIKIFNRLWERFL